MNLRQLNPSDSEFLKSERFTRIKQAINNENLSRKSAPSPSIVSTPEKNKYSSPDEFDSVSPSSNTSSLGFESLNSSQTSFILKGKSSPKFSPPFCSSPISSSLSGLSSQSSDATNSVSLKEIHDFNYCFSYKRRQLRTKCSAVMNKVHNLCQQNGEELSAILARCCSFAEGELPAQSRNIIDDVLIEVARQLGLEKKFKEQAFAL